MKKDKEFFNQVIQGDRIIIDLLKKDKLLRNIQDNNQNNIVHYLIAGEQTAITKELLDNKLISYQMFKNTLKELLIKESYKNDNYYNFLCFLKYRDKENIIKRNIETVIKNNNIKSLQEINLEELTNKNISFLAFVECNDEMFENVKQIYVKQVFTLTDLKSGFNSLKLNKIRTSRLIENLGINITPLIYEELSKVNDFFITYMENRDLYHRLEQKLEPKHYQVLKKI